MKTRYTSMIQKKHQCKIFTLFAVFLLLCSNVLAQDIAINATLENKEIRIGEQTTLTLTVTKAKGTDVKFPVFNEKDSLTAHIEIVEIFPIDSFSADENEQILKQKLLITSFDSGYHQVPGIQFLKYTTDAVDTIKSNGFGLHVTDVINYKLIDTARIDSTGFFPEKDIYHTPLTFKEFITLYYPYIIAGVLLIAIIFATIYFIRLSKKNKAIIHIERPKPQAHLIALEALNKLKEEKLWQQQKTKEYYSRLTDILRVYIENRFHIPAMERTSYEIFESFTYSNLISQHAFENLKQILSTADMVKFAKAKPLPEKNTLSMDNAYEFVKLTKLQESQKTEKENDKNKQNSNNNNNIQ